MHTGMPSQLHEALLLLFRNRPELAPELLRECLHLELPPCTEARIEAAGLRARIRCEVCVLVVTVEESVAHWAARRVPIGGSNSFAPLALGPSEVPVVDDEQRARRAPELAVFSAMAPGAARTEDRAASPRRSSRRQGR